MKTEQGSGPSSEASRDVPAVEVRDLGKSFGPVQALTGVSFRVVAGEVVGLVGDNGAGKTTLVRCIAGIHRPDEGGIYIDGTPHESLTPESARLLGVETVHQNLSLVETFDVMENFFLNRELYARGPLARRVRWLNRREMYQKTDDVLSALELSVRPRDMVATLSGGQRQIVAVARAVTWGRHIVMMDEPAAALGVRQTGMVLDFVRMLASRGAAVIFVSHNIQHVLQVTDRVVVLRHGEKVADIPTARLSAQEVVSFITGAEYGEVDVR